MPIPADLLSPACSDMESNLQTESTAESLERPARAFRPHKERPNYQHMLIGLSIAIIVILICSLMGFTPDMLSLVSLAVFDFLFVFLICPLKGPLLCKVFLLLLGNTVGLTWSFIRTSAVTVFPNYSTFDSIKVAYVIIWPIIDFLWIVCIWALGLSLLVSAKSQEERGGAIP